MTRDVTPLGASYMTDARKSLLTLNKRHPGFVWQRNNGNTKYVWPNVGETWGDSPGTTVITRERGLPSRTIYGGFAVMSDSDAVSGGALTVTSLPSGNRGSGIYYKTVIGSWTLDSRSILGSVAAQKVNTGIGVYGGGASSARLFYIRNSDSKLVYRDYTGGAFTSTTYAVTDSPTFSHAGVGVAPVSLTSGFALAYDSVSYKITVYRWSNSGALWESKIMPIRYEQNPLNCQWFDAELLGSSYYITFNVNGVQYGLTYDPANSVFSDPLPVISFTAEYGGAQTRICKLMSPDGGNSLIATAWTRVAGSSDDYEVSYYHLMTTKDGVNWSIPEEGYIGPTASRGKLHVIGDESIIIGASVSYVGSAVLWLGGSVGSTNLSQYVVGTGIVQDIDAATEGTIDVAVSNSLDPSLLQYGDELVAELGVGMQSVTIGKMTLDSPGHMIDGYSTSMSLQSRGPLKKLSSYTMPMDLTIDAATTYNFDFKEGGLYARKGIWDHEPEGIGYCDRHDGADALATIGLQYKGQFQITTKIRITGSITGSMMGIVFWYEGPDDYYRFDITPTGGGRAVISRIENGVVNELANLDVIPAVVANTWYDLILRYKGGILYSHIRATGTGEGWYDLPTFSNWDRPEPALWYAGLYCVIPTTALTADFGIDVTSNANVVSTVGFPTSGEIKIDDEIIRYFTTSATKFGTNASGSLVRGVRTLKADHSLEAPVTYADRRFEVDYFVVFQDDRPMSVADACAYVSATPGVDLVRLYAVNETVTAAKTFAQLHGHSWVFDGRYQGGEIEIGLWTNSTTIPTSGIKIKIITASGGRSILSDIAGGEIERHPVSIPSTGKFKIRAEKGTILVWVNDSFLCGHIVPGDQPFRVGNISVGANITYFHADELFEACESIVWSMEESARDVLSRVIEGRDACLRERWDGSVQVTLLEKRENSGILSGMYVANYQKSAADDQWASAMIAWGAEEWVVVSVPGADRIRWTQWKTPHIYDRETLRKRAMMRLRKLWALKDVRVLTGPYDPKFEIGDEITISDIRGVPAGQYMIRSIEIKGSPKLIDMNMSVQALPPAFDLPTWPIRAGIDFPSTGNLDFWETPLGALKGLYDANAWDNLTDTASDYAAGNGAEHFGSYTMQEFDGKLFFCLSNVPMNGTGAIVCRIDKPGQEPIFEYNLPEEGSMRMYTDGTLLYITGAGVRNDDERCGFYTRDLAGNWNRKDTLPLYPSEHGYQHILGIYNDADYYPTRLYIAGQGEYETVSYSEDGGDTWTHQAWVVGRAGNITKVGDDLYLTDSISNGMYKSITARLQDQDDANFTPGAGVDEYALCWDDDTARFVLRAVADSAAPFATIENNGIAVTNGGVRVWQQSIPSGDTWSSVLSGTYGSGNFVRFGNTQAVCLGTNTIGTIDSLGTITQYTTPFTIRTYYNTIGASSLGELYVLGTTGLWMTVDLVNWREIYTYNPAYTMCAVLGMWNDKPIIATRGDTARLMGLW